MILEDVKTSLRISESQTAFDREIHDLIEAARLDLQQSGVSKTKTKDDKDALIKRAITVYCKAHFGINNTHHDQFKDSYNMIKQHISLAGDYR